MGSRGGRYLSEVGSRGGRYLPEVGSRGGRYLSYRVKVLCELLPAKTTMEPMEPVADVAGELPAKKKGSKGLPSGFIEHRSGKYQVRLLRAKVDGKAYQRPIPGLYEEIEEALEAQAAAQQLFESGGVEAVWPPKEIAPAERNKRGEVRRPAACSCTLSFACT